MSRPSISGNKTSLDAAAVCRETQLRFPPGDDAHQLASRVSSMLSARTALVKAEADKMGPEIQRETLMLINFLKSRLAPVDFSDMIARCSKASSQRGSLDGTEIGSADRGNLTTKDVKSQLLGGINASLAAANIAARRSVSSKPPPAGSPQALVFAVKQLLNGMKISPDAVKVALAGMEGWLEVQLLRMQKLSLARIQSHILPGDTMTDSSSEYTVARNVSTVTEEYLLACEDAAAMYPAKLAGAADSKQAARPEELRALALEESESFSRTSVMLRRLSVKDCLTCLRLEPFKRKISIPPHISSKYIALASQTAALADLRSRLPTQPH